MAQRVLAPRVANDNHAPSKPAFDNLVLFIVLVALGMLVAMAVLAAGMNETAMATCQLSHSLDVCLDTIAG